MISILKESLNYCRICLYSFTFACLFRQGSMGFLTYYKVGSILYNAYNDGWFDPLINDVAYRYPRYYNKVNRYLHYPARHHWY
ncbi:unnamed protein product [Rotaria sordida]|uniref:Uncharacterized protein n=1 Tax=Rotaria sordida TaxID=392033 RepID=A0A814WRV2_9BILA|nr:unnamed protein product [Rotaria sordida]